MARPTHEAGAQTGQSRDSTIALFSRDLAKLQSLTDSLAYYTYSRSAAMERAHAEMSTDLNGLIDRAIAAAAELAARWKNDPYVGVEGFEVEMGL